MTTTKNRVVGIQGFAGTGKSHMLKTAKAMVEEQGFYMRALAPYGSQVKALRELGVESNTLASFLRSKNKNMDERTVLVIDEAGVVPTKSMEQALRLAEKTGVRVVLMGDIAQTKAIEAGRPFHQLQDAGMCTAHMREIQRQNQETSLKEAVEWAAKGKTTDSLRRIPSISEIEDDSKRHQMIVNDYMNLSAQDRDQTLIVAGTNKARREMNQMVRKDSGISGRGIEFDTLIRRDITQAERKFSKHYRMGDVIQPEKDYHKTGLKRGEFYKVTNTGPGNRLTVFSESGENVEFNPMTCQKISVYQPERTELAKGDVVRITRNDAKLDVANGDRMKVESVTEKALVLSDGKRLLTLQTDKPLHLDYAYATTVHGSQGLTSDRVFIDMRADDFTTNKEVYYVAVSRAKKEARIYTNNIKELPQAIARENLKQSAFDIVRQTREIREKNRILEKKIKIELNLTQINDEKVLQRQ